LEVLGDVKWKTRIRRKSRAYRGQGGFTLLEIIVTIVIAAIMGVFFVQFVATNVIHSTDPVRQVQNLSGATHIMEYMTKDYKWLASTQSNFLATFKDYVAYGNGDSARYPGKPIGYPYYGQYDIVYNDYIIFGGSPLKEQPVTPFNPDYTTLKVSIRRGDQTVTALFTK
jgi:prepilin-type N-terminal cleavage/methylation domain-containing protein